MKETEKRPTMERSIMVAEVWIIYLKSILQQNQLLMSHWLKSKSQEHTSQHHLVAPEWCN